MKIFIIYIFLILALFSCNQNDDEINISLEIPANTIERNDDSGISNNDLLPYTPNTLIEYLKKDNNIKVNLGVMPLGKKLRITHIKNFKIIPDEKKLILKFITSLERAKKVLLLFKIGDNNFDKELEKTLDANTDYLFLNASVFNTKNNLNIDMTLLPMFTFSGNILEEKENSDNIEILTGLTKIKSYVSVLDKDKDYTNILNINTSDKTPGSFSFSSIYSRFKDDDSIPAGFSNVIVTAKQDDKVGFTLVSKEYNDFNVEETREEYFCYKYYDNSGQHECGYTDNEILLDCEFGTIGDKLRFNKCTSTQSGNLLPGIKLSNDINLYTIEQITQGVNPLISSVSTSKFAKIATINEGDPSVPNPYYGNFFITGFNFTKLKFNLKDNEQGIKSGTIRIHYDIPDELKEKYSNLYIEYRGAFTLYRVGNKTDELKLKDGINSWVMQNRLPFFEVYLEDTSGKKVVFNQELREILKNDLKLNDGLKYDDSENFLGVKNLEKTLVGLDNFKVMKIEFSEMIGTSFSNENTSTNPEGFEGSFEIIYTKSK